MYIERQLEKKFIAVSEEYACVLLMIWRSADLPKQIPRCS